MKKNGKSLPPTDFQFNKFKSIFFRDFSGSAVVKTSPSNAGGVGLIPGQ